MPVLVDMNEAHTPVLADELVEGLELDHDDTVVDCTFGGGGHGRMVAERLGPDGELIAIDRDPHTEAGFYELRRGVSCRLRYLRMNYADALSKLGQQGVRADAVYLDLGISSMQVDNRERGFSYSYDAPLDMRMDPSQGLSAAEIVNTWPERRLENIFRRYGEERYARRIARTIARGREKAPYLTTAVLVEAIKRAVPTPAQFGSGHPARRVFQALRIAVNDELGALERALPSAWDLLVPGGTMAVISFHSLEDRMVKRFFADLARGCDCPPDLPICVCGRRPSAELRRRRSLVPSPAEVARNPRSRAARLRVARRIEYRDEAAA